MADVAPAAAPQVWWSAEYGSLYTLGPGPGDGPAVRVEPEVRFMPSDLIRLSPVLRPSEEDSSPRLTAIDVISDELCECFVVMEEHPFEARRYAAAALNALGDHPDLLARLAERAAKTAGDAS